MVLALAIGYPLNRSYLDRRYAPNVDGQPTLYSALRELNGRIYGHWRREIAAIVREGQAAGAFAPAADPDAFARGYAAVIDGLATHVVLHAGFGAAEMEAACRAYVDAQLYVQLR